METTKKSNINPIVWGLLLFFVAQVLTLLLVQRIDPFWPQTISMSPPSRTRP